MDEQKNKWLGQQIKLIAEGDTEAISRIYTEIGKVMFAVATIYLKDPADREDVVQDALLTIVRKADRFRENKNAYGWITKIVENLAKNKIVSNKKHMTVSLEAADIPEEINDSGLLIYEMLRKLSEEERGVLVYKFWHRYSLSEMAKLFHKPKSSVRYILVKALKKLKNLDNFGD